jgi:hypothetical protein
VFRRITKRTLAAGLALCLSLAFTPFACGGSGASQGVPANPHGSEGPTVPDATVSTLRACAGQGKDRLKEKTTYTLHFDVEVTEDGDVDRVRTKESRPVDRGMESCMAGALEGMRVPLVVEALTQRAEEAEAVSPPSRGLTALLLDEVIVIELVPVAFTILTASVLVGVSIYLSKPDVKKRRIRRKKPSCDVMFSNCQDLGWPCTRFYRRWGTTLCGFCNLDCFAGKGYRTNACYACGFQDPD